MNSVVSTLLKEDETSQGIHQETIDSHTNLSRGLSLNASLLSKRLPVSIACHRNVER